MRHCYKSLALGLPVQYQEQLHMKYWNTLISSGLFTTISKLSYCWSAFCQTYIFQNGLNQLCFVSG